VKSDIHEQTRVSGYIISVTQTNGAVDFSTLTPRLRDYPSTFPSRTALFSLTTTLARLGITARMSYHKQAFSRKQWITALAEDAKSIFSSETSTPEEKKYFLMCNPWYAEAGVEGKWSDHVSETDLMALVVLDDLPTEVIPERNLSHTGRRKWQHPKGKFQS
jgi:hypothetical protein